MRGGKLVDSITRATYPHKRIACGKLTRWAPINVSGNVEVLGTVRPPKIKARPTHHRRRHHVRRGRAKRTAATGWFANWFAIKQKPRRGKRRPQQ